MGSDQSTSSASDQRQRNPGNLPFEDEASSSSVQTTGPEPQDQRDPDTDLPQCRMGTRKCEKMDLKIIQSLLERVQICKDAGKRKNFRDLEIFLKNIEQFNCSGQTRDS